MSVLTSPAPARSTNRRRDPGVRTRHLEVVPEKGRRLRGRVVVTIAFTLMFAVLLGTVAFHVRLVQGQQRIDELNRQSQAAQQRYNTLRVRVDTLSSPQRIITKARALGMVTAQDPVWLPSVTPSPTGHGDSTDPSVRDYLDVKPYLQEVP